MRDREDEVKKVKREVLEMEMNSDGFEEFFFKKARPIGPPPQTISRIRRRRRRKRESRDEFSKVNE